MELASDHLLKLLILVTRRPVKQFYLKVKSWRILLGKTILINFIDEITEAFDSIKKNIRTFKIRFTRIEVL